VGLRTEQHPREKPWLTLKVLHKGSSTPGEEKEAVAQKKDGVASGVIRADSNPSWMRCQPRQFGSRLIEALKRPPHSCQRIITSTYLAHLRQPLRRCGLRPSPSLVVRPQAYRRLSRTFHGALPSCRRDKQPHAREGGDASENRAADAKASCHPPIGTPIPANPDDS
jgi:hypothetical protein